MMYKIVSLALCLLFLVPAAASAQVVLSVAEQTAGENRIAVFSAAAQAQDGQMQEQNPDEAMAASINLTLEARFAQQAALRVFERAKARDSQLIVQHASLYQDEQVVSAAMTWLGEQADGMQGCSAASYAFSLETGEELTFDSLFDDVQVAVQGMEAIIEADIVQTMSDYMVHADLLPMPQDCFSFDPNGLTVYYSADRYSYFSGQSGAVHFTYDEIAPYIGESSPLYALAKTQESDAQALAESLLSGRLGAVMAYGLQNTLGDALGGLTLLSDPDYTRLSKVYLFEEPELRGYALEIPRYVDTPDEQTSISAVRASRIALHGLVTGKTTRTEITALLGEPMQTMMYSASDAEDDMLVPGESLFYEFSGYILEAHLDESGVLSCLILRASMPERLY